MAMDKDILGAAIDTAVNAIATAPTSPGYSLEVWTEVADKIISHIQANAEVSVTSTGETETGPTTGPYPITDLSGSGTVS
ncbi:MAG: hypothetical protein CMF59_12545 [Leptospiraceae bacterium]|nr:hypothetical protein [Leptospiraceae bacterium]